MTSDATPRGLTDWVAAFVADEQRPEMLARWVDRTTKDIAAEIPEITAYEGLAEEIRLGVLDHWAAFLAELGGSTFTFHLVDRGRAIAVNVARLGIPLETLIRFYRVGQQSIWQYITGIVGGSPAEEVDHAAVLIYFWDRASTWIDLSITESVALYQAERGRLAAGVDAQRYEAVQAVLSGRVDDARRISAALGGYPMSVHHTALVLASEDDDAARTLECVAQDLARGVGSANPLLLRPGGRRLWAWFATKAPVDTATIVERFDGSGHGAITVGVGSSSAGIAGFAESHREAGRALEVAGTHGVAPIVAYVDVEPVVLLGCSAEVDRFMERTLRGLAGADESSQRIRETVAAFLAAGGSADDASRALRVHRNTVRYRLGQAEEILGRPVARISTELDLALRHHRTFHAR